MNRFLNKVIAGFSAFSILLGSTMLLDKGIVLNAQENDAEVEISSEINLEEAKEVSGDKLDFQKLDKANVLPFARWSEADVISKLNDDIVSFGNNPQNRWTDWKGSDQLPDNWVVLAFGSSVDTREVKINKLDIHFYYDNGVQLPVEYKIEKFVGETIEPLPEKYSYADNSKFDDDANWEEVNYISHPEPVADGVTTVEFNEVTTKAIRIKMVAKAGKSLGITEVTSYGEFTDKSDIKRGMTNDEVIAKINELETLKANHKKDFTDKVGTKSNEALYAEAKAANDRLYYYENEMVPPAKPNLPELKTPLYGGWFRTWHDQNSDPNEDRPNYFGNMPKEVDLAFVFHDWTKDYSKFWDVLTNEYVPEMNKRGTRVLRTISIRNMYQDVSDWAGDFPNTDAGNKARAEFMVDYFVNRHGLDGIDIDIEYHDTYSNGNFNSDVTGNENQSIAVMKEMARILHEQGKIFMIDTNMSGSERILTGIYSDSDYVMLQAYGRGGESQLNSKWANFKQYIKPEKFMLGFSFYEERDWNKWGDISDKVEDSRAERYAYWQPDSGVNGNKAGLIGYAIDRDGVKFNDDAIYTSDYSLSKQLKLTMLEAEGKLANKTDLQNLYDSTVAVDTYGKTEASIEAFEAAKAEAKAQLDDLSALQEDVDKALANLQKAINGLEDKMPESVDKSELQTAIKEAENIDLSTKVNNEKLDHFKEVLAKAKMYNELDGLTEEQINLVIAELKNAQAALMDKNNKEETTPSSSEETKESSKTPQTPDKSKEQNESSKTSETSAGKTSVKEETKKTSTNKPAAKTGEKLFAIPAAIIFLGTAVVLVSVRKKRNSQND